MKRPLLWIGCLTTALAAIYWGLNRTTAQAPSQPSPELSNVSKIRLSDEQTPATLKHALKSQTTMTDASEKQLSQQQALYLPRDDAEQVYEVPPIANTKEPQGYQGSLDDYEAYQAFQHNQKTQLKLAYIDASKQKIVRLNELLKRGKQAGISLEQISFAEEKIAGLKALQAKLITELEAEKNGK